MKDALRAFLIAAAAATPAVLGLVIIGAPTWVITRARWR